MIVKAKPLKNLCEHEGRPLPRDYKSDCWGDVDETEYACSEKRRILLRLKPPGSENAIDDNYIPIFREGAYKIKKIDLDRYRRVFFSLHSIFCFWSCSRVRCSCCLYFSSIFSPLTYCSCSKLHCRYHTWAQLFS